MPRTTPIHKMGRTSSIIPTYDKLAFAFAFNFVFELCIIITNAPKYINVNPKEEMKLEASSLSLKNGDSLNTTNM